MRRRSSRRSCDDLHVDRIEAGRRLVEHADLRIAQQDRRNLDLLRHALAQAIDPPRRDVRQLDLLEPGERAPPRLGAAEPLQRAEVGHHVDDRQLGVEAALLRQVAEAIEVLAPARLAEHEDAALVGADDVHQDADQRALAGAVRAEQAEDLARRARRTTRRAARRSGRTTSRRRRRSRSEWSRGSPGARRRSRRPRRRGCQRRSKREARRVRGRRRDYSPAAPWPSRCSSRAARLVCEGSVVEIRGLLRRVVAVAHQADAVEHHLDVAGGERHVGRAGAIGIDRGRPGRRRRRGSPGRRARAGARCPGPARAADSLRRRSASTRRAAADVGDDRPHPRLRALSNCSADSARRSPITTACAGDRRSPCPTRCRAPARRRDPPPCRRASRRD